VAAFQRATINDHDWAEHQWSGLVEALLAHYSVPGLKAMREQKNVTALYELIQKTNLSDGTARDHHEFPFPSQEFSSR
jgi:hypothetical protein